MTGRAGRALRALSLAAALAGVLGGCSGEPERAAEPVVAVQAVAARRAPIRRLVTAEAIIFPRDQAILTPKLTAPVRVFYVERGSRVRRGQLLATLENRDLVAAQIEGRGLLEQAQANYQSTKAAVVPEEVRKARFDAEAAREELAAQQKIFDTRQDLYDHGALPRRELDQAHLALVQARARNEIARKHLDALLAVGREQALKGAAAQLEAARGKYLGAEAQLRYSEIRSPLDGVVTDGPHFPGEIVTAGVPLVTVMDFSSVVARAHVPQAQAALLKAGDAATIAPPGGGPPIAGAVSVVSPAVDPNSTTVEVWVRAANPGGRLHPGETAAVSIVAATVPDAIVVPASALIAAPDGSAAVMVVGADSRAHRRPVRVGLREGDTVRVVSGLRAGERVVAVGAYGLEENTRLQVEPAPRER